MKRRSTLALALLSWLSPAAAHAVGEPVGGFPNWEERVLHEWTNRARVDPQADLAACPAGNCEEKACYVFVFEPASDES